MIAKACRGEKPHTFWWIGSDLKFLEAAKREKSIKCLKKKSRRRMRYEKTPLQRQTEWLSIDINNMGKTAAF